MKKVLLSLTLSFLLYSVLQAQEPKFYGSSGLEMIFTYAIVDNQGDELGSVLRWSPVLNIQAFANYDPNNVVGFFTGLGIRNVGFIYDIPDTEIKMKYRTYNLAIPIGLKIGKLDHMFLFTGYEIEFPFNYKEKKFENEVKDKFVVWFSERVEPVQHSLMAGIQFPYGLDLKFKYYLTNFHNEDFKETGEQGDVYPYKYLKSNICLFSLGWNLFTNFKVYDPKNIRKETVTWR